MNNKNNIKSLFNNLEISPSDGVWDKIENRIQNETMNEMNFQNAFIDFEVQPSTNVWDKIEIALHEKENKPKVIAWWYYGAAVAVILAFFTFLNHPNRITNLDETASKQSSIQQNSNTSESLISAFEIKKSTQLNDLTQLKTPVIKSTKKEQTSIPVQTANFFNLKPEIKSSRIERNLTLKLDDDNYSIELLDEFEEFKRNDFAQRKQFRSNSIFQNQFSNLSKTSTTQFVYNDAGNFNNSQSNSVNTPNTNSSIGNINGINSGTGVNSNNSNAVLALNTNDIGNFNTSLTPDIISTSNLNTNASNTQIDAINKNSSVKEIVIESTAYGMPVTLSGNFYLPISSKLGISSGIGYTFIESHTTNYLYDFSTTKKHEFLTIPIELEYSLVSNNKFNFYSCLGSQSNINRTNEIWNINSNLIVGIGSTYRMDKRFGINLSPRIFIPTLNNINYGIKAGLVYFVK